MTSREYLLEFAKRKWFTTERRQCFADGAAALAEVDRLRAELQTELRRSHVWEERAVVVEKELKEARATAAIVVNVFKALDMVSNGKIPEKTFSSVFNSAKADLENAAEWWASYINGSAAQISAATARADAAVGVIAAAKKAMEEIRSAVTTTTGSCGVMGTNWAECDYCGAVSQARKIPIAHEKGCAVSLSTAVLSQIAAWETAQKEGTDICNGG